MFRFTATLGLVFLLMQCMGCADATLNAIGATVAVTAVGGHSPAQEIEQIYYLGVFDPQDQVPPTIYRVRVHGQASAISLMKFGTGWAPAALVDSLSTQAGFDLSKGGSDAVKFNNSDQKLEGFQTGRRLVMFGPEGFREAPANHRLVIVMGSSPESFFGAIDESLGVISEVRREQLSSDVSQLMLQKMVELKDERLQLERLGQPLSAGTQGGAS